MPILCSVKRSQERDKPRNADDYFTKLELLFKGTCLESKKEPDVRVLILTMQLYMSKTM